MTGQRRRLVRSSDGMNSCSCHTSREGHEHIRQTPRDACVLDRTRPTTVAACRGRLQHNNVRTTLLTGFSLALWINAVIADGAVDTTYSNEENTTIIVDKELPADIKCSDCDVSGRIAGAVIGSLIGGLILGAALTYLYLTKRGSTSRGEPLPPKDYDVTNVHFDVNRNDEAAYDNGLDVGPDKGVKGHKKLERLAKTTPSAPVDIEIPSVATPLILSYDSPGEDNPGIVTTPSSSKSLADSNLSVDIYSNQGQGMALNQPYEALDIIPEEVEYENSKCNEYEQVLMESPENV